MPRVRVHQHVNPLAKYFRELPIEPLDFAETFRDAGLPLHLDIGCGRGRFLLEMARKDKHQNFLGVEIREPLVLEANKIRDQEMLGNLDYEFCNASIDLDVLFSDLPEEMLKTVSIQFPDPWFKKRHAKRRMVKDNLVETITAHLGQDGKVYVQTDVEFLAEEIYELFTQAGLRRSVLTESPMPVKSEREKSVEKRKLPVFRALYKPARL